MEKWPPLNKNDEITHRGQPLIVRWASKPGVTPSQKIQMAVELGIRLLNFEFSPAETQVRQRHELAHCSAVPKVSQLLALEDPESGKIDTGTIFLEELTVEEELAVLGAPDDPQIDDLIQTAEIKSLMEEK